jgi:hypothetical protein
MFNSLLVFSCRFFNSCDREFHVASLPYKPDFKVMPEGWDGTTRDPDEVLYEISMKEDQMLYEEFVQRLEFNKKKVYVINALSFHHVLNLINPLSYLLYLALYFFVVLIITS